MAKGLKGRVYPPESASTPDPATGAAVRQVTNHPSVHHHPFFFVPAYDDAMRRLLFVSHRTGSPQVFAEDRATRSLVQLTDRPDLADWSPHPSHDGRFMLFTAGAAGWRLDLESLEETCLVDFSDRTTAMREGGTVGAAMGTTALSRDDRWWAVAYKVGAESELAVVDTRDGRREVVLRRDSISHMQFCPDDSGLLSYSGPVADRLWVVNRDGTGNRRVYARDELKDEWITHETWIPGTRELAFVDWPHGVRAVRLDGGAGGGRERRVCSFNAWHAVCNRAGTRMVADTNHPDVGIQVFDPRDGVGRPATLCLPGASNAGEHWKGPFPYGKGPVKVYAPQHTHPHPSFSPDGRYVVFTSDRSGHSQVYECEVPRDLAPPSAAGE